MSHSARDLLVRGIAAARADEREEARFYLKWALTTEATFDQRADALRWLSKLSDDPAEQRSYLEQALAYDPNCPEVHRKLAILDGRLDPREIIDPNRLPPPAPRPPQPALARRFICQQCGGRMSFTADRKALTCKHCGNSQTLARGTNKATPIEEEDFILALATAKGHRPPVATRSVRCQGCGASFVLAPETISLTCPYCASVYVVELTELHEVVPPEALIPFAVTEVEASRALRQWLQAKRIGHVQVASPTGIYFPVWTFDVAGEIVWRGWTTEGEDGYRRVAAVSGSRPVFANDVPIPASRKLPARLADEVRNFALEQLVPYDPRYLADWPAEIYEISPADASLQARQQTFEQLRPRILDSIVTGEDVDDVTVSSGLAVEAFKLILVPLWIAHYSDRERRYDAVVNGQTGTVRGERPRGRWSKWLGWILGDD